MMGGLTSFPVPLVERVSVGIMASYGLIQKAKPTREDERVRRLKPVLREGAQLDKTGFKGRC